MTGGELPAGDDLDRLIHERVLGHCAHEFRGTGAAATGVDWDIYTCAKCGQRIEGICCWEDLSWYGRYSTNIADAWTVVLALEKRYWWDIISPMRPGAPWWAALAAQEGSNDYEASGETAPEAICRAALLAVEGETRHAQKS